MSEIGGWQRYQHWPCYPLSCFQSQRFHPTYDGAPFLKIFLETVQTTPQWIWLNNAEWLQSVYPFGLVNFYWPRYYHRFFLQGPQYNLRCTFNPEFLPVERGSWLIEATAQAFPFNWEYQQTILWPIGQLYWPRNQIIDFYQNDWIQVGFPDPNAYPPSGRGELAPRQCCPTFQWGEDPG